jgi:two-component system, NtrC family, nitrogen regulation sensor histidine kinase NtrY
MSVLSKLFQFSGEKRYYVRDFTFLAVSIVLAVILAETFLFQDKSKIDFVDRIFGYSYFAFPFFILVLFFSYLYRTLRIRQTGKIRSVIRYRLTIAFIFVSILPSIPVFILSSNVIGRLVESFYQIDIADALNAAKNYVFLEEVEFRRSLFQKAKQLQKSLNGKEPITQNFITKKAFELSIFGNENYYIAYWKFDNLISETKTLRENYNLLSFKKELGEEFPSAKIYAKDKSFLLFKLESNKTGDIIVLGRKIHIGTELNAFTIINTENAYNSVDLWKEKVPFALRLTLGIFSIGMFAVSIIVSFLLARQISHPIVLLAQATQRVSRGERDVVLDIKEEGEMGILLESFNQMTIDLKAKTEELMHIQRVAAWKEVAQRMAHEIKNPLTPIQLSAERIRRKLETANTNPERFAEIVKNGTETIVGQVRVLEHLVKEFSEFARMPTPVLINQHLNPIVEESVNLFKDNVQMQFEVNLSKNLPEVFLDKRLFLGVINNLIKNAVEAIQAERKERDEIQKNPIIRIQTKLEKKFLRKTVVLIIEDNGPGISPKIQEKIFEPYFSTKEGHGMGIGLTIVQKTVYDHHGYIHVDTSSLGGCRFIIELPTQE